MTAVALNLRLAEAAQQTCLDGLRDMWRMDEISVTLPGMGGFAAAPSLGAKLRGAFGCQLLASASSAVRARRPCDWPQTSTAEFFFGRRPQIRLGGHDSEIAKPFVLSARAARNGGLRVVLRIFGLACERTDSAASAFTIALGAVNWRALSRDTGGLVPQRVEPACVSVNAVTLTDRAQTPHADIDLLFTAPIDADRGNSAVLPELLLRRLLRRLALLAPWHGGSLADQFNALQGHAEDVEIVRVEPASLPAPAVGGHRRANRLAPPCRISLKAVPAPILTALEIGRYTHIGRGAAIGLGRYRLV